MTLYRGSDQDHPQGKKCKKAKWLSEEALEIAEKRREAKGKREKERYTHLNEVFQRIARRDKKAFHSGQCKEIEENNRMGKTRDLFRKLRDTKETFPEKNIYFCFIDYAKDFDSVDHNKLWEILQEMGTQTTWPASWETYMQVRKQQLELDMEQQTGSKRERNMARLYIVTLLI